MLMIYEEILQAIRNILGKPVDIEFQEPDPKRGDIAFACFSFAKIMQQSPQEIASRIVAELKHPAILSVHQENAFVNIYVHPQWVVDNLDSLTSLPKTESKIVIEYVSPNTNKPLHLGHMRNMALGESVARIYEAFGHQVVRTILINDRGIAICKSMVAYQNFHLGETPEIKGDHYVGNMYVEYSQKKTDELEMQARQMLLDWESKDEKTIDLWKKMNDWVLKGHQETYQKAGIRFDEYTYESDIYTVGKEVIIQGLKQGLFEKHPEGYVYVDLTKYNLGKKVLLRSDGTALYITQDIALLMQRFYDQFRPTAKFERMVYVTAYEQDLAFKQLFAIAGILGLPAEKLYHLSYGMVNLPDGRMKSREGTVVDADHLITEIEQMVAEKFNEMRAQGLTLYTPSTVQEEQHRIEKIARAAYNFYLLLPSARKDMVFDKQRSIELRGKTGPYIQYTYARLCALLDTYEPQEMSEKYDYIAEKELVVKLARYRDFMQMAKDAYDPSLLTRYTYELAEIINTYYPQVPVKKEEDAFIRYARQHLLAKTRDILKQAMHSLHIPAIEHM
jgi:arginyl-tRNA synthetase